MFLFVRFSVANPLPCLSLCLSSHALLMSLAPGLLLLGCFAAACCSFYFSPVAFGVALSIHAAGSMRGGCTELEAFVCVSRGFSSTSAIDSKRWTGWLIVVLVCRINERSGETVGVIVTYRQAGCLWLGREEDWIETKRGRYNMLFFLRLHEQQRDYLVSFMEEWYYLSHVRRGWQVWRGRRVTRRGKVL